MTFSRRRISIAAVIFFGLCLGFIVSEIGLRLLAEFGSVETRAFFAQLTGPSRHPKGLLVRHPTRGMALRNNFDGIAVTSDFKVHYRINSAGFRDREYPIAKPPGVRRVLALGDSFTFGEGISEGQRYTDLLEKRATKTEIITMGVPGYGLDQVVLQFFEEVERWSTDEVWLFLNVPMIDRNHVPLVREGLVWFPDCETCSSSYVAPKARLTNDAGFSQLFTLELLTHFWPFGKNRRTMAELDAAYWKSARFKKKSAGPVIADSVTRGSLLLRELVLLCRTWETELTVIAIEPKRSLAFLGELPGFRFLDLGPKLDEASRHQRLSFKYDLHFNPRTNASIADNLMPLIRTTQK